MLAIAALKSEFPFFIGIPPKNPDFPSAKYPFQRAQNSIRARERHQKKPLQSMSKKRMPFPFLWLVPCWHLIPG
jgi:hypothetical protein